MFYWRQVVRIPETSNQTFGKLVEFGQQVGKTTVEAKVGIRSELCRVPVGYKKGIFLYSAESSPSDQTKTLHSHSSLFIPIPTPLGCHSAITAQRLLSHIFSSVSLAK